MFREAEQWLNGFKFLNEAWELASVSRDWKRILLIAGQCDKDTKKAFCILYNTGRYSGNTHPSNLIILNALEEGKKAIKSKTDQPQKKRTCTLEIFMTTHCEIPVGSDENYFESKRNLIYRQGRVRGGIKLPKLVKKWKSGQPKLFYETDLLQSWPKFCIAIPSLPHLKNK